MESERCLNEISFLGGGGVDGAIGTGVTNSSPTSTDLVSELYFFILLLK
jgi:hypothetical protein